MLLLRFLLLTTPSFDISCSSHLFVLTFQTHGCCIFVVPRLLQALSATASPRFAQGMPLHTPGMCSSLLGVSLVPLHDAAASPSEHSSPSLFQVAPFGSQKRRPLWPPLFHTVGLTGLSGRTWTRIAEISILHCLYVTRHRLVRQPSGAMLGASTSITIEKPLQRLLLTTGCSVTIRIPRVNMQKSTPRNIKTFPQYKNAPSRHVVFACRRLQLHRFWHVNGHRFWHVDGRSYIVFWHVHGHTSFWHVDGRILHVDGHIYYSTLYYSSFPGYFFASRAVILTCRRAHFACRRTYYFTLYYSSFPGYFFASRAVILTCRRAHFACRRAHLLVYTLLFFLSRLLFCIASRHFDMSTGAFCMSTGTFTILHFTIFPSPLLFCIGSRHFDMSMGAFCMSTGTFTILHFTILPFQATFLHREPSF